MLASVRSAVLVGVDAHPVHVEVHVASHGLPGYNLVGLPDAAVREARERMRAAIVSSGFEWPQRRITVNLAPSGLRKTGAGLDLPAALGVLVANGALPEPALEGVGVIGELGLDGSIRPVPGTLALVDTLRQSGAVSVLIPMDNAAEAALVGGIRVLPCRSLAEARACLKDEAPWPEPPSPRERAMRTPPPPDTPMVELGDVRGLAGARRALEVAVAGGHHLLLVGPPGAGKTLLAHCLPSILPPLADDEALEVTKIHSAAGHPVGGTLLRSRPFRAPHHTASAAALVGGGSGRPRPGEATLAHRGALFLDELGEFTPRVLDALRQPLEERVVRISRQHSAITFPADFLLVASTNPCPCGLGPPRCTCNDALRARYRRRLSGPLVDRFDLRVAVGTAPPDAPLGPPSAEVAGRVARAVTRQAARYRGAAWRRNAAVPAGALLRDIPLSEEVDRALQEAARRREWSGRGLAGVRRVARTLADLDDMVTVTVGHVLLAAGMREDVLA
ncbi:MAG: YifB family Mg chelatase-like AAA ATPase [Acidimicrobiia bacterium]